jgi:hypothetical protein
MMIWRAGIFATSRKRGEISGMTFTGRYADFAELDSLLLVMPAIQRRKQRLTASFSRSGSNKMPIQAASARIPWPFYGWSDGLLLAWRPQAGSACRVEAPLSLHSTYPQHGCHGFDLHVWKQPSCGAASISPDSIQIAWCFSGGISVQVPTNDQEAILASINRLGPTNGIPWVHLAA